MSAKDNICLENVKEENKNSCVSKTPVENSKIFNLLEEERLVVIRPKLAVMIGLNEAIILQQIKYWLQRSKHVIEGRVWFYKTNKEWKEELPFLSEMTIRRAIESLESQGLILTRTSEVNFSRTKYYRLNDHIENSTMVEIPIVQNEQVELFKMNTPIVQNEQLGLIHRVHIENNNIERYGYTQEEAPPNPPVVVSSDLKTILESIGIMGTDYWLKTYKEEKIREKLALMPDKTKITSSQAAWLRASLDEDYRPPKNVATVKNGAIYKSSEELATKELIATWERDEILARQAVVDKLGLSYLPHNEQERKIDEYRSSLARNALGLANRNRALPGIRHLQSVGEIQDKTLAQEESRLPAEQEKRRLKGEQEALKTFMPPPGFLEELSTIIN